MPAETKEHPYLTQATPIQVFAAFFKTNSVESATEKIWYLFKAWVEHPDANRAKFPDEEIALFLDQLIDLVAADFKLHQANGASSNQQETKDNG